MKEGTKKTRTDVTAVGNKMWEEEEKKEQRRVVKAVFQEDSEWRCKDGLGEKRERKSYPYLAGSHKIL